MRYGCDVTYHSKKRWDERRERRPLITIVFLIICKRSNTARTQLSSSMIGYSDWNWKAFEFFTKERRDKKPPYDELWQSTATSKESHHEGISTTFDRPPARNCMLYTHRQPHLSSCHYYGTAWFTLCIWSFPRCNKHSQKISLRATKMPFHDVHSSSKHWFSRENLFGYAKKSALWKLVSRCFSPESITIYTVSDGRAKCRRWTRCRCHCAVPE